MHHDVTVQLPVAEPLARGYQYFAFPLAIHATDERTTDWVLSNFIQLEMEADGWHTDVPLSFFIHDYANSPWLETVSGTRGWYAGADIRDVIRGALARGYYAYLFVDEWHIPRRRAYGAHRMPHDILVHGADAAAGTFTVLGYDERMQFTSTEVAQDEFATAYAALDGVGLDNTPVTFYRLRAADEPEFGYPPVQYELNLPLIRQTVQEYLCGQSTRRHFAMLRKTLPARINGVAVYDQVEGFLRGYAAGRLRYDIRHLHIIWEHKRLMTLRIRRIAELVPSAAALVEPAVRIEDAAADLRNAMMRDHLQNGRPGYLDSSLAILHDLREAEVGLLTTLVRRLDDADTAA